MKTYKIALKVVLVLAGLALMSAQGQFRLGRGFRSPYTIRDPERIREQEMMEQALNPEFKEDVFTFARLITEDDGGYGLGSGRGWDDDTPNAELNMIFRLHDVTSLKVRPGLNYINITAKDLANYPFVYLAASGRALFTDEEVITLRHYLLNGGFLMADDFWGDEQWAHFHEQIRRIFPDREPVELPLDHRIFHSVIEFHKKPQIPSVGSFYSSGQSWEAGWPYNEKNHEAHFYAIYDDKQRMVALLCHNNHFGDGWEHEGDDETYFDRFSDAEGYPMLINILVYAMTH